MSKYVVYKIIETYTKSLNNKEIDNDYLYLKKLHKKLENVVEHYITKYPYYIFLLNGSSNELSKKNIQYGGKILTEDIKNKIEKLSAIFHAFKVLDMSKIKNNVTTINEKLDKILNNLNKIFDKIPENEKLQMIQSEEKILNSLNLIINDTENIVNNIGINVGINIEKSKSKVIIPIENYKLENTMTKQYLDNIINDLTLKINNVKNTIKSASINNNSIMNDIINTINKTGSDIDKYSTEIITITKAIKSHENDLNFNDTEIQNELTYIFSVSEIKDKIYEIKNKNGLHTLLPNNIKNFVEIITNNTNDKNFAKEYEKLIKLNIDNNTSNLNLPKKCFFGKYSEKISNNILLNESNINEKINLMHEIIKDDEIIYNTNNNDTFENIYAPDFTKINNTMYGGVKNIENKMKIFNEKVISYYKLLAEYKVNVRKYNILQTQITTHTLFLLLIVTNQLFVDDYIIYNYINKGIITFYNRIIKEILYKIQNNSISDEILYFKKYHMITLIKLSNFFDSIISIKKFTSKSVIDIRECTGRTSNMFLLLNYFKGILDAYRKKYQKKITIYSRINDINKNEQKFSDNNRFFSTDLTNPSIMYVNKKICYNTDTNNQTNNQTNEQDVYNFTEVFDTINFPTNGDISKYMTLDSRLSSKEGIAIMTYGYSGTGKTFTLFGDSKSGKEGILQSTLENINGLSEVKFRLFELYGYGLSYSHYWKNEIDNSPRTNKLGHEIFHYNIILSGNSLKYIKHESVSAENISSFINNNSTYTTVPQILISDVFRNFESLMTTIDSVRKGENTDNFDLAKTDSIIKKRIRDTPNNIVSSRSVLIFDFKLKIKDEYVTFMIIDLPGKEEIIQTYIEPFFDNKMENDYTIKKIFKSGVNYLQTQQKTNITNNNIDNEIKKIKFMLATMALNPISVPMFDPELVLKKLMEIFNNDKDTFNLIKNSIIEYTFNYNDKYNDKIINDNNVTTLEIQKTKYIVNNNKIIGLINNGEIQNGFKLEEELINRTGTKLGSFIDISNNGVKIIQNNNNGLFGYNNKDDKHIQCKALLGFHIFNRLLYFNKFDILYEIFKELINDKLNKYLYAGIDKIFGESQTKEQIKDFLENMKKNGFKKELIEKTINEEKLSINDVKNIITYDYYLTPLEGIYINENIVGITTFLTTHLIYKIITGNDENKMRELKEKLRKKTQQDESLNFQRQQQIARMWLISSDKKQADISKFFFGDENNIDNVRHKLFRDNNTDVIFDYTNIDSEYQNLIGNYDSSKIFSFDHPIITDVLKSYVGGDNHESKISDYKIFYLFGNYNDENVNKMKCEHQNDLLKNTKYFIDEITTIKTI